MTAGKLRLHGVGWWIYSDHRLQRYLRTFAEMDFSRDDFSVAALI